MSNRLACPGELPSSWGDIKDGIGDAPGTLERKEDKLLRDKSSARWCRTEIIAMAGFNKYQVP